MPKSKYQMMPIDAKPGTKVYFYWPDYGYSGDREHAKKLKLRKYRGYTVDHTEIHSSTTTLWLKEFPNERFNTVQFAIKG